MIALYARRLDGILTSDYDFAKLYFLSFAVSKKQSDNELSEKSQIDEKQDFDEAEARFKNSIQKGDSHVSFSIKNTEPWDSLSYVRKFDETELTQSYISALDLYKLVSFLLCIFEFRSEQSLSTSPKFTKYFKDDQYQHFQKSALCILRSIDPELPEKSEFSNLGQWENRMNETQIIYPQFEKAYHTSFSHLFEPLSALFGSLLYSTAVGGKPEETGSGGATGLDLGEAVADYDIFQKEGTTKLINPATMAQLGTMFGSELYFKLKKLYVGTQAGFSLQSFEGKVFKWQAPTLLLVYGRRIGVPGSSARERQFNENIPPLSILRNKHKAEQERSENGQTSGSRPAYLFGAFITEAWKSHTKHTFGNDKSLLIELEPVQDKFLSEPQVAEGPYNVRNPSHEQYAYFARTVPGGIGFGSAPPHGSHSSSGVSGGASSGLSKYTTSMSSRVSSKGPRFSVGNVSLTLDDALEFGVFRHVGRGGSYRPTNGNREMDEWEDRFDISEIEVWGSGGDEDLEEQRKKWEWEEREALYRQRVNIKNMGEERAFLEMAGLIGNHGSGGSMG